MKKLLLGLILGFVIIPTGFAARLSVPLNLDTNFYLGVFGNKDAAKFNVKQEIPSVIQTKSHPGTNKFGAGIFGGFGLNFHRFFLGAELHTVMNTPSIKNTVDVTSPDIKFNQSIKLEHEVGFDLVPGYFFTKDIMLYGRFGVLRSELSVHTDGSVGGIPVKETKFAKSVKGSRIGIGLEAFLNQYLSLRGEFSVINYSSLKNTQQFSTYQLTSDISPKIDSFNLSLVWYIDRGTSIESAPSLISDE